MRSSATLRALILKCRSTSTLRRDMWILLREGYDVALRVGTELTPGLVARTVARTFDGRRRSPRLPCGTRHPKERAGFARSQMPPGFHAGRGCLKPTGRKQEAEGSPSRARSSPTTSRCSWTPQCAGSALRCCRGCSSGRRSNAAALVQVLPELIHAETRVSIVYQEKELLPPQVRAFIDALIAWAPTAVFAASVTDRLSRPETPASSAPARAKRLAQRSRIERR